MTRLAVTLATLATAAAVAVVVPGTGHAQQKCVVRHNQKVCRRSVAKPPVPYRAFGYVTGRAVAVPTVGHTGPAPETRGAKVTTGKAGSPQGVYCLILSGGPANASPATVSQAGEPADGPSSVAWIPYAPECTGNAVEVRTWTEEIHTGQLVLSPSDHVSFSFVVP